MIDSNKKPIFEYSDAELKSFGFDILEQIEFLQKDLSLLRIELSRRRTANVLSSSTTDDLPNLFSNQPPTDNVNITPSVMVGQELITPLRK
jgi:hypothetical protein